MKNTNPSSALFLFALFVLTGIACCKKDDNNNGHINWLKYTTKIDYNSDSVSEVTREEWTYDNDARPTGKKVYNFGALQTEQRNYVYNGDEVTYLVDEHSMGTVTTTKYKETNQKHWIRLREQIKYDTDGITQKHRYSWTYDANDKITAGKMERDGKLYAAMSEITYTGNVLTYIFNRYTDSVLLGGTKYETGNYQDWVKPTHDVIYGADNVTEYVHIEYTYDADGRLINVKRYNEGALDTEDKDYSYNGNEATYKMYDYDNGVLVDITKHKVVYFNR